VAGEQEWQGRSDQDVGARGVYAEWQVDDAEVLRAGMTIQRNITEQVPEGERILLGIHFSMPGANGTPVVGGIAIDVTERMQAEAERATLAEALRVATSIAPLLITVCDRDLRYTWYSRHQPGWPKEPVLGKRPDEVAPPDVALPLIEAKRQVLQTGEGQHRVLMVPGAEGERVFEYHFEPLHDESSQVTGVVSAAYEITRIERLRRQLQEREANFRAVLRHAPVVLAQITRDLCYRWVHNPRLPDNGAGLAGRLLGTVTNSPQNRDLTEYAQSCFATGQTIRMDYITYEPDGTHRYDIRLDPIVGANGTVESVAAVAVDMTEHYRLSTELAASEARFQTFMEHLPARAWIKDAEGHYLFTNRALRDRFGLTEQSWQGLSDHDVAPPDIYAEWHADDLQVLRTGEVPPRHLTERLDGDERILLTMKFTMPSTDGTPVLGGIAVDVTDQRRTEAALRESQERLRLTVDAATIGLWDWVAPDRVIWNRHTCAFFGVAPTGEQTAVSVAHDVFAYMPPEDVQTLQNSIGRATAGNGSFRFEFRTRVPGRPERWFISVGRVVGRPNAEGFRPSRGACYEITELKRMAEALAESEARLRLALEGARMGLWEWYGGDLALWSPQTCTFFGVPATGDWTEVPLAQVGDLSPELDTPGPEALMRFLQENGGVWNQEIRVALPGQPVRWVRSVGRLHAGGPGRPQRLVGVMYDITQTKEATTALQQAREDLERRVLLRTQELAETNQQLQQEVAERLQAEARLNEIRRLIARHQEDERMRLAHELHDGPMQELATLTMELTLLARKQENDLRQAIERLRDRLKQTNSTLRAFAGDLRPAVLDSFGLLAAIESQVEQVQERLPALVVALALEDVEPLLDSQTQIQLVRVFQQALHNVQLHAEAQHVWVSLHREDGSVVLEVRDDGRGFEVPSNWVDLARTGHLGIVGMSERMSALGGSLHVRSEPGEGTTVRAIAPLRENSNGVGTSDAITA
jgi:PAS domain S-box-containing protein